MLEKEARRKVLAGCAAAVLGLVVGSRVGGAQDILKPHDFTAGLPALAAEVNENFDLLFELVNQLLADADQQADQIVAMVPAGTVMAYAGNTVPAGYYECDGTSLNQADEPALFAAIGTRYGGSGPEFKVPDYRGFFLRAWDNGAGIDPGRGLGTSQDDELRSHTHSYADHHRNIQNQRVDLGGDQPASHKDLRSVSRTTGATGKSETRPKNVSVMYIIKR